MSLRTAVLLSKERYLEAIRSAEAKDRTVNYRKLKADRSISLLYNPATEDGKFTSKLNARSELANGYYEAFPHIDYAETLAQNNANLLKYGWPEYEKEGV
jgi:5-hydroxyisourate hydrolase-like protein (transthyretin family)